MARRHRLPKGPLGIVLALIIAGAAWWQTQQAKVATDASGMPVCPPAAPGPGRKQIVAGQQGFDGRLLRVSDGDTAVIRYGDLELYLRLLNIDTAESVHRDASRNTQAGKASSAWAKQTLEGQRVWVEFKTDREGSIARDRHQRALAWLWLDHGQPGPSTDDVCYNLLAIHLGHSPYVTDFDDAGPYHAAFAAAAHGAAAKPGK